jgi:exopolyphosphatase/guanosine-5'-triphosphate,3'-diphosphate pyrophosphatase
MRVAIIDLGTNTFNLLVAERIDGKLHVVRNEETPVFLGQGGIEKGMIAPDALERGMTALRHHVSTARRLGAERITGFGTSALRNARNATDFVGHAKRELDLDITVIPGDEEATLILDGVRQALVFGRKPMLVMDIGGGSIEFILATDKALMWKRSFELGVTRLRERFSPSDPITVEEESRIAAHLDDQLAPLWNVLETHEPAALVGIAGSFDSLVRIIEQGTPVADDATSKEFTALAFGELKDRIMPLRRDDRLRVPGLPKHRVDTIVPALIAIERVLAMGIDRIIWSRYALKEGAAARAFDPRTTLPA